MWLWILSGLVVALAWTGWFFFLRPDPSQANAPGVESFLWIPIGITAIVIVVLLAVYLFRRVRAARAARALEKAIAQQAQEQALAAKPEQRAEIQELHRQIQEGIETIKRSKLGGGKRGSDALYALPWYVMVGPPGAGKTTALRHSGLTFPYLDPTGGGVKGVGGTRNCEWWFTNEAILLDTAGRYMTEAEDHDEWMAFLEQLLKYRTDKPINGVIVAVSISELMDANEESVQQMGKKIRARIDEMQATLHMAVPVYVVFTKADLIAGFTEFFGDLKKSERAQPWGATFRLDANRTDPGKLFDTEFDLLVERAHTRALRRMALERSREVKEKVYQFPLEFAAIKRNLSDFLQVAFAPGSGASPVPLLRGAYFSSGTQEGRPLDRVVGAMARAFGLKPAVEVEAERGEKKSYFLRDVFQSIIFPDAGLALRSEAVIRRERNKRLLVAALAAALGFLFVVPAIIAFRNNRKLIDTTKRVSTEAAEVKWQDGSDAGDKVAKLDSLRDHLQLLDQYEQDGPPISHRWGMYQGTTLFDPAKKQYVETLKQGFVTPTRDKLEAKLKEARGEKFLDDYNTLKTYLLLDDMVHLAEGENAGWETDRLTNAWAEVLRPTTAMSEQDLKMQIRPHVAYYVDLLRRGLVKAEPPLNRQLVEQVQDRLRRVGDTARYYEQFVTTLIDQKYDESGPDTRENLKYPPVTLNDLFGADRPEVLAEVRSSQRERTQQWFKVEGPYTAAGYAQVMASLKDGYKQLDREQWVLPFTDDEKKQGDRIQKALDRVRDDYETEYMRQWERFFRDIDVAIPQTNREAIGEFRVLATPDWPYLRLLRTLSDNTQFDDPRNKSAVAQEAAADGGVLDQIKTRVERRIDSRVRTPGATRIAQQMLLGQGAGGVPINRVQEKFRSMVEFGVPPPPQPASTDGVEGAPPPQPKAPGLGKYVEQLEKLAGEMGTVENGPIDADTKRARESFEEAVRVTQTLLLDMDKTGQELMEPLLMNPLRQAYQAMLKSKGAAASGLWEVVVAPPYEQKIRDRYPFNTLSSRDASYEDAVAFFKPKDGILWGFYDTYLKEFHDKVGHQFIPKGAMGQRVVNPKTPFNPNMYNCLRRADEITDALWGSGGENPRVVFNINLKTVSPIVSEVIFELDGQRRTYRNEKEFWYQFAWPGEKATGAKIQVRGAGGLDEELSREGPWGIFRLFEAGSITAQKESDEVFTVTWQMTAPPVTVTMEVRPTRANHPFPSSFFRATNCPHSIGDTFGPPKG